ncbi:MAG TPA: DoxX family protein [Rhodocyclaceae bacterium]|nr:DoxX family protein [Rhodocyclaceae bacterium]
MIIRTAQTYLLTRLPQGLDAVGAWLAPLSLRLLLAYEFFEAGLEKLRGDNWFAHIQSDFPLPFNLIPAEINWQIATWAELLGPIALLLGLFTRFASISLIVLTVVAWVSVHAGNGYNVCDNGFKLPLIYLVMLVPLVLSGPGRLSIDHWLAQRIQPVMRRTQS